MVNKMGLSTVLRSIFLSKQIKILIYDKISIIAQMLGKIVYNV